GDVKPKEPLVEVNKEWNHGLIAGLIPLNNATMDAAEYVNNAPNYVVKTNQSFLNQLVSVVTCFIYTPTQTKYYIPLKDTNKQLKK
ncbi:MAG: Bor family protein, partial [Mucinivorans sp.]